MLDANKVETACCIWEALIDGRDDRYKPIFDKEGTASVRTRVAGLVDFVDAAWEALPSDVTEGVPFDWEWVPAILAVGVDLRTLTPLRLTPLEVGQSAHEYLRATGSLP